MCNLPYKTRLKYKLLIVLVVCVLVSLFCGPPPPPPTEAVNNLVQTLVSSVTPFATQPLPPLDTVESAIETVSAPIMEVP